MDSHSDDITRNSENYYLRLEHHHITNEIFLVFSVIPSEDTPIRLNVWDILSRAVRYYKCSVLTDWLECLQYTPFEPFWQYLTRLFPLMVSNII